MKPLRNTKSWISSTLNELNFKYLLKVNKVQLQGNVIHGNAHIHWPFGAPQLSRLPSRAMAPINSYFSYFQNNNNEQQYIFET